MSTFTALAGADVRLAANLDALADAAGAVGSKTAAATLRLHAALEAARCRLADNVAAVAAMLGQVAGAFDLAAKLLAVDLAEALAFDVPAPPQLPAPSADADDGDHVPQVEAPAAVPVAPPAADAEPEAAIFARIQTRSESPLGNENGKLRDAPPAAPDGPAEAPAPSADPTADPAPTPPADAAADDGPYLAPGACTLCGGPAADGLCHSCDAATRTPEPSAGPVNRLAEVLAAAPSGNGHGGGRRGRKRR